MEFHKRVLSTKLQIPSVHSKSKMSFHVSSAQGTWTPPQRSNRLQRRSMLLQSLTGRMMSSPWLLTGTPCPLGLDELLEKYLIFAVRKDAAWKSWSSFARCDSLTCPTIKHCLKMICAARLFTKLPNLWQEWLCSVFNDLINYLLCHAAGQNHSVHRFLFCVNIIYWLCFIVEKVYLQPSNSTGIKLLMIIHESLFVFCVICFPD